MLDELRDTVNCIDDIQSVTDEESLRRLDECVQRLFTLDHPERWMDALFRLFERFPLEDAYGGFWTILHGIEKLPGYESKLVESIHRQPAEFSLRMVNRLLNAGYAEIDGVSLLELLEEVANTKRYPEAIRKEAIHYIEWQRSRTETPLC